MHETVISLSSMLAVLVVYAAVISAKLSRLRDDIKDEKASFTALSEKFYKNFTEMEDYKAKYFKTYQQLHEAQALNRQHAAEKQARLQQAETDANYVHVMPAMPTTRSDDIDAVERLLDMAEMHGLF